MWKNSTPQLNMEIALWQNFPDYLLGVLSYSSVAAT
jgi:hypothetical protein